MDLTYHPEGKGFVSVEKMSAAGTIPSFIRELDSEGEGQYSVSVFHQLHCLVRIPLFLHVTQDQNSRF